MVEVLGRVISLTEHRLIQAADDAAFTLPPAAPGNEAIRSLSQIPPFCAAAGSGHGQQMTVSPAIGKE